MSNGQFQLEIMLLKLEVDRQSYNIQCGCEGYFQNAIIDAPTREENEL